MTMTVIVTDNFDRANQNPIAGNWSTGNIWGNIQILSNEVAGATGSDDCAGIYTAITWPNDQYSEVRLGTIGASDDAAAMVRITSNAVKTAYLGSVINNGTGWSMSKFVNSTYTELATGSGTFVTGDRIRLMVRGFTLSLFQNGTLLVSKLDSSIASGYAGFQIFNTGSYTFTEWEGGGETVADMDKTNFPKHKLQIPIRSGRVI